MNYKKLAKPTTMEGQVDMLWDIVANHLLSKTGFLDWKLNFVLVFLALVLALLAILISRI